MTQPYGRDHSRRPEVSGRESEQRGDPDFAALGRAIGHSVRAKLLLVLLGGPAVASSDLANAAGVAPSVASTHLRTLESARMVQVARVGRRRMYSLDRLVAETLESLGTRLQHPRPTTFAGKVEARRLAEARTCYDHLAGRLGVALLDCLKARDLLLDVRDGVAVTEKGSCWFQAIGIDVTAIGSGRRPLVRTCLDWTERKPHLAGGLGAALAREAIQRTWIRRDRPGRAVRLTRAGAIWFEAELGLPRVGPAAPGW